MKKLIAVGTDNSDPKKWRAWENVELYIADSIEEALKMAGYNKEFSAVEIDMSVSRHILSMPSFEDD